MGEAATSTQAAGLSAVQLDKARRICELVSEGSSMRAACLNVGVNKGLFHMWCAQDPDLATQYARAREDQADVHADEIIEVADRADLDANDKRVRVDARKWVASKLRPKRYGDAVKVEHAGEIATTTTDPNELVARLVTMGTQYPTLNPVIRKLAQDILDQLPEIRS